MPDGWIVSDAHDPDSASVELCEYSSMKKRRCFLALLPQTQLHRQLFDCAKQIQSSYSDLDVRWIRAEQFHMTIQFLGNLSNEQIEKLDDRLSGHKPDAVKPIAAAIPHISLFPTPVSPRVIAALINLTDDLKTIHRRCQLPEQKPSPHFRPHISLARCRPGRGQFGFTPYPVDFELQAKNIYLIESQLTSRGPVYSELGEYSI